jgi:hypothetical protein
MVRPRLVIVNLSSTVKDPLLLLQHDPHSAVCGGVSRRNHIVIKCERWALTEAVALMVRCITVEHQSGVAIPSLKGERVWSA